MLYEPNDRLTPGAELVKNDLLDVVFEPAIFVIANILRLSADFLADSVR